MTGSLQIKGNKYYVFTRMPDDYGKLKSKWISTGISVQGNNKRKAQKEMRRILTELEQSNAIYTQEVAFLAWIDKWMEQKQLEVRVNTLEGYQLYLEKHIRPYFQKLNLPLSKVNPTHIQSYFNLKLKEGQSLSTLKKHNAVIRGALQEAVKKRIIPYNPVDGLTLPKQSKQDKFKGTAYTAEQAQELLSAITGDVLYPAVFLGLCYGLRKSEVLGLRWQDIDFTADEMHIKNTVTRMKTHIEHEKTKSNASKRTLKLIPNTKGYLQKLHREQLERRLLLGESYKVTDHVCVWPDGRPFLPHFVSSRFKLLLQQHELPIIRFHDLRHTAGSLLIAQGMNIKQIQEFLGHEQSSTTLDIYTHIDTQAKQETAVAMGEALKMGAC